MVPIRIGTINNVVAIAAGDYHNLALKGDGSVWAWGNNVNGQLGSGNTSGAAVPVQVPGISHAVSIAA